MSLGLNTRPRLLLAVMYVGLFCYGSAVKTRPTSVPVGLFIVGALLMFGSGADNLSSGALLAMALAFSGQTAS